MRKSKKPIVVIIGFFNALNCLNCYKISVTENTFLPATQVCNTLPCQILLSGSVNMSSARRMKSAFFPASKLPIKFS